MCLLIVAWRVHPRYPLLLAGNRDELHARPAAALDWWTGPVELLAGRDLEAGGTWLGVTSHGRLGVVTNVRGNPCQRDGAPSRGAFIPRFAASRRGALDFATALATDADAYAGFNLLLHDGDHLVFASNSPSFTTRALPPGVYGLSNDSLDVPWPKVVRTRARFNAILADDEPRREAMFEALADTAPATAHELATSQDREPVTTPPFVLDPVYGTRCTTLVLIGSGGIVEVEERRYDARGATSGTSAERFLAGAGTARSGTTTP